MDPSTITFLTNASPYALLLIAVWYLWQRDLKRDAQTEITLTAERNRCDNDRKTLTDKVDRLEDRISELYENTIKAATYALDQNVQAFGKFLDNQNMTPPKPHRHLSEDK